MSLPARLMKYYLNGAGITFGVSVVGNSIIHLNKLRERDLDFMKKTAVKGAKHAALWPYAWARYVKDAEYFYGDAEE